MLYFFTTLPESPRFLHVTNDVDGAMKVLKQAAKENKRALPSGRIEVNKSDPAPGFCQVIPILLSRGMRNDTLRLFFIWFANASIYYGLVMLPTAATTSSEDIDCVPNETVPLPNSQVPNNTTYQNIKPTHLGIQPLIFWLIACSYSIFLLLNS